MFKTLALYFNGYISPVYICFHKASRRFLNVYFTLCVTEMMNIVEIAFDSNSDPSSSLCSLLKENIKYTL